MRELPSFSKSDPINQVVEGCVGDNVGVVDLVDRFGKQPGHFDLVLDVLYLEVLAKGFQTCRPGVTLLDLSVELTRIVCSVGHQVSL